MQDLSVVVLAAGKGTRMKSRLPKVLQPLAGRPLLAHVLDAAVALEATGVTVVYGHGGEEVRARFAAAAVEWVEQAEQRGTGHAVQVALPRLPAQGRTLILYGDVPLIRPQTLRQLVDVVGDGRSLALLTLELADPTGYGRILRDARGRVQRIVEQKDGSAEELAVREVNTGIFCVPNALLHEWLPKLRNDNKQGEYYLTDIVGLAAAEGVAIHTLAVRQAWEVEGVNDKLQLAALERQHQRNNAEALMRGGVTLLDPARFDLRGTLEHGQDVEIDINVVIEGQVRLGHGVKIGPNVLLRNAVLGDGVVIKANTVIEDSEIGAGSDLGPFARLRPGSVLGEGVHVGNFVELKKARLGKGAKAGHLAYLGDAEIGERVNVSAGVITCNYDGANKHVTTIGDDAFIGTDSQLVAPVTIERGAYVAAGSTITRTAPADALTICRARDQKSIPGWKRPVKKK
ncbi:bifunctional UDP-N-acetylglucosamine diphosphorylase/glucosamine-1-phosphate N-acetyltransferase GlmU [Solimonas fluminis]|uniref:bifunctional UDP-N-acetylglucosamine diphosphorylase/glucosamine-1-phosphate N-acetyltransferase GlmU n=1 Tax=Solimonas fluminis TaxID=2086571 RepID=UPI001A9C3E8F|nr:bifunctional UDP-N-acetylglucosamine diphosphorylase/glucosamine-1-phosphate N-acetyltransferase GlmU [Solimonas fluminis]